MWFLLLLSFSRTAISPTDTLEGTKLPQLTRNEMRQVLDRMHWLLRYLAPPTRGNGARASGCRRLRDCTGLCLSPLSLVPKFFP